MTRRQASQALALSLTALPACQQREEDASSAAPGPAANGAPMPQGAAISATQLCQARIAQRDAQLRAVIELNPDALSIAARLDTLPPLSALHGRVILIKDNLDTADGMHSTAGSLALLDSRPARDADVVQRLRGAGLVIVGKTNLSEWANIRSPRSTSGWSARGGLTRNPHSPSHSASGSSSGSAAAVAAGYTSLAIGTETNGSIVSPAAACGVVGMKPTLGLVSGRGIIPITHHQDTAGPITATVADAAALLATIADPGAVQQHRLRFALPAQPLTALRGVRLGVLRDHAGEDAAVLTHFDQALARLRDAGAQIIHGVTLPQHELASRSAWAALFVELHDDLRRYLQTRDGSVRDLAQLIAFNTAHRAEEMPHFGQEFLQRALQVGSAAEFRAQAPNLRALATKLAREQGIDAALTTHRLDALICPTNDPTGLITLSTGDDHRRVCSTPAAIAGYPHLTVPMAAVDGLPIGLSFMGTAWADELLLALGAAFEALRAQG